MPFFDDQTVKFFENSPEGDQARDDALGFVLTTSAIARMAFDRGTKEGLPPAEIIKCVVINLDYAYRAVQEARMRELQEKEIPQTIPRSL